MSSTSPFTMAIDFAPDDSRTSFRGSVTITKTTLTVFKTSGGSTTMRDSPTNERATFVGVCSLPLIQFYRHKNVVTLLRGTSFLFDNAATSIGLASEGGAAIRDSPRSRRHNPSMWESLAMRCATLDDCDRVVEVLLTRSAEETFVPPFPVGGGGGAATSSRNTSTPTSVNSYSRHNEHNDRDPSRHSHRPHSRHGSPTVDSRRPASSHISERPERHDSAQRDGTRGPTPQTDVLTPRSSRLPSRRENDDTATQTSARTRDSTPRSSRLPSRRENDETATVTTAPTQSLRSSQQRVAPGRSAAAASAAAAAPAEAPAAHRHRSSEKRRVASAHSPSGHRRRAEPAEREFAATAEDERPHSRPHAHRSHSARSPHRTHSPSSPAAAAAEATAAQRDSPRAHRHASPRSARTMSSSAAVTPASASVSRRHMTPRTDGAMDYSASVSPRSTVSRSQRSGQEAFFRSVQRLQHHRLHFMQYLHKEMVHQAFLAEEAKLKAATRPVSPARRRTHSPTTTTSAGAPVASAEEAARLREIEARLAQVEALHREAEREREEAARLRREYEWRNDEMNTRMGAAAAAGEAGTYHGSRDVSEPNSSVITPHRSSAHPANGQLVLAPQHNGGGSGGYSVLPHAGFAHASSMEWALTVDPAAGPRPDDVDLGVAIVDRYVFGEEWNRVYPAYEADIRFNAQIDVCLAMKMPRRLVTITNVVVDRPGLRVTAEIRYDRAKIERDGVERRMGGCPFRFLQRFYDMRDLYDPMHDGAAALTNGSAAAPVAALTAASRRASAPAMSRRPSRTTSTQRRRSSAQGRRTPHAYPNSDVSELSGDLDDDDYDVDLRRDAYHRRADDRMRAAEERMAKRRKRVAADLRRQLADNAAQLAEEEAYHRDNIHLAEAKGRQRIGKDARSHVKSTLSTSMAHVEEEERVERAAIEVGAARQLHVLMGGHRRTLALFGLQASEAERRRQVAAQEAQERRDLNDAMNPQRAAQRKTAERRAREAEVLATHGAPRRATPQEVAAAIADLEADEVAARAIIRSQAMEALLDLLFRTPAPTAKDGRRAPSHRPSTLSALLRDLQADEAAQRKQIAADERRRRGLYQQENVLKREAVDRVSIEVAELDARDAILDSMMALNRHQLERRLNDREQQLSLINEEQFYRKTILSDEQDAFEVIAELFAAGLKDLLAHVPEPDDEDEDLRRRRVATTRQAKPFHYMTFTPDDMDYPPSAVLAIEGIVGCSINKNLEVVSVARPLPKAEEEDLQLQAGDMILDVAGHSLHSLSHLREVLSNRAMQIQEEALAEFPDVPQDQRTVNPALQKYIEVLCEHHNFLVQVLRGCEIYQIIVRS